MSNTEDARRAASELAQAIRDGNESAIVYWQVRLAAIERGHRRGFARGDRESLITALESDSTNSRPLASR